MGDLERLRHLSFLPNVRIHNMHNCEDSVLMKDGIDVRKHVKFSQQQKMYKKLCILHTFV